MKPALRDATEELCHKHRTEVRVRILQLFHSCVRCTMRSIAVRRARTFRIGTSLSHEQVWGRKGKEVTR